MREHPILFSGPMVRAILENRKTQTRRVLREDNTWLYVQGNYYIAECCPYGQVGDRLWVRETWRPTSEKAVRIEYRADGEIRDFDQRSDFEFYACGQRWRPSIFMPRWASRITLEIVAVRPERLQEINVEDARAEGCSRIQCDCGDCIDSTEIGEFQNLWDSIHGKRYPWASNPWVWRIEFMVLR